ncbi:hypothetical protein HJD18_08180 [Thermoleophilia bacterium SCSIO 60948]|nr:hypothetical protein HJD18_08180 [Thermoleophilia bacterium SCSIO 60948]
MAAETVTVRVPAEHRAYVRDRVETLLTGPAEKLTHFIGPTPKKEMREAMIDVAHAKDALDQLGWDGEEGDVDLSVPSAYWAELHAEIREWTLEDEPGDDDAAAGHRAIADRLDWLGSVTPEQTVAA